MIHTGHWLNGKALGIAGILFFVMAPSLMASGTIKGKVFDKESKDALPGANVVIKGTTIGAATDLNGMFAISNAPSGEQTITVSYLGYVPTEHYRENSRRRICHARLLSRSDHDPGRNGRYHRSGSGQIQAINQQLNSDKIVSVVSEAKIQELPDFNAAEAIGRLPGVPPFKVWVKRTKLS